MKPEHRILLFEDDDVDAMIVRRALKEVAAPHPLDHVMDGVEGLAFLRNAFKVQPSLILLDLNMPRMNGIEFLTEMRKDPSISHIPVVVLTTSLEESDRVGAFKHFVAGYMVKPMHYPQFVQTMRTIIDYWGVSESPSL